MPGGCDYAPPECSHRSVQKIGTTLGHLLREASFSSTFRQPERIAVRVDQNTILGSFVVFVSNLWLE